MKSRKGLLVLAIVLFGGLFFAFKSSGIGGKDIIIPQKQRLLAAVGTILEEQHYSPKNTWKNWMEISHNFFNQILQH